MIPPSTQRGVLPPGIHSATMAEIYERFARFTISDQRKRLYEKLAVYLDWARASRLVERVFIVGSFVTEQKEPEDIDLVIAVSEDAPARGLSPAAYNATRRPGIRRVVGTMIDAHPYRANSPDLMEALEFFQSDRQGHPVGIVEVILGWHSSTTTNSL
jgi:hypothetical protein